IGGHEVVLAGMAYLRTRCRFIAMMPQWDFLNFLAEQGRRYPAFHLRMQTEVTDLIEEQGRIAGIRGNAPSGPVEIRADLVVGADGRNSVVRERAGLVIEDIDAPRMCCGCGSRNIPATRSSWSMPIGARRSYCSPAALTGS